MSEQRYVDPNSGAAPQPGGFAHPPVIQDEGQFDAAVADEVTEEQEAAGAKAEKEDAPKEARKGTAAKGGRK